MFLVLVLGELNPLFQRADLRVSAGVGERDRVGWATLGADFGVSIGQSTVTERGGAQSGMDERDRGTRASGLCPSAG